MSMSDLERHRSTDIEFEEYVTTGFNFRLTDIQAAIGIEQLRRLPELIAERRGLASAYCSRLASVKAFGAPAEPAYARSNWQSYVVTLRGGLNQLDLMRALKAAGIPTRRGVMCAHLEAPYRDAWPRGCLPQSETARDRCVILPMYPGMSLHEIDRVVEALRNEAR
jgi:dTDP-4-amino-4,6-dideoxygalactose transaminase